MTCITVTTHFLEDKLLNGQKVLELDQIYVKSNGVKQRSCFMVQQASQVNLFLVR